MGKEQPDTSLSTSVVFLRILNVLINLGAPSFFAISILASGESFPYLSETMIGFVAYFPLAIIFILIFQVIMVKYMPRTAGEMASMTLLPVILIAADLIFFRSFPFKHYIWAVGTLYLTGLIVAFTAVILSRPFVKDSCFYRFEQESIGAYLLQATAQFIFIIPGYSLAIIFHLILYKIGWLQMDLVYFLAYWGSLSILVIENYKALRENAV